MVLGSEVICSLECSTVPVEGFLVEEAQNHHDQADCIPQQVEGNRLGYHHWEPILPYQDVIIYNYQVEVSMK